jgi:hypothetical protein
MVKRKIILCCESLRIAKTSPTLPEKYSYDAEAIIELLKNNFEALQNGKIEIEPVGFGGKDQFMKEVPLVVKNRFAEYRYQSHEVEIFIIAVRDSDTNNSGKIAGWHRQLVNKIKKVIKENECNRVHIMFAVQAIEAWILADEKKLNEYLGVQNKAKHENDPEEIDNPKQIVTKLFAQYHREKKYTPQQLLDLLPQLSISELLRCKHFKKLYDCVQEIVAEAS